MRIALVALALALLTVPGYAQMTQTTARSEQQQKADKEADTAYRAMIKNVPDKPRNTDPWADVRSSEATANNQAPARNATHAAPGHAGHPAAKKPK